MNPGEFEQVRRGQPRRLTPEQVAELLGITPRTLRLWRQKSIGPIHIRIGKKAIRYDEPVVMAWLERQKCLRNMTCCPTCGTRVFRGCASNMPGVRP